MHTWPASTSSTPPCHRQSPDTGWLTGWRAHEAISTAQCSTLTRITNTLHKIAIRKPDICTWEIAKSIFWLTSCSISNRAMQKEWFGNEFERNSRNEISIAIGCSRIAKKSNQSIFGALRYALSAIDTAFAGSMWSSWCVKSTRWN